MHEKTGKEPLKERILDHRRNQGRDQGELATIHKKLNSMSHKELRKKLTKLNRTYN